VIKLRDLQTGDRPSWRLRRGVYWPHLRDPHRLRALRWFWALHAPSKPGSMRTSNQAATLDEAQAEFEASWKLKGVGGDGRDRMRRDRPPG